MNHNGNIAQFIHDVFLTKSCSLHFTALFLQIHLRFLMYKISLMHKLYVFQSDCRLEIPTVYMQA